jgi:hypothetical protein
MKNTLTSNATVSNISIKQRADRVYDVYINDDYVCSKGSLPEVLKELSRLDNANAISF